MDLGFWRDLVIVVWGAIATLALVFFCILGFLIYRRLAPLMDNTDAVVQKVGDVVDYTREEVISPVVQFTSAVQGIMQGINIITDMFKKKEGRNE
jgi:hypothetical protein